MTDGAKAVCAKHEQAYAVADGCPYCEEVAAAEPDPDRHAYRQARVDPARLTSATAYRSQPQSPLDRLRALQDAVSAGLISVPDAMKMLSGDSD